MDGHNRWGKSHRRKEKGWIDRLDGFMDLWIAREGRWMDGWMDKVE